MLIILVDPSGAGKSTIESELHKRNMASRLRSHTTRSRRAGESGEEYCFVSSKEFIAVNPIARTTYDGERYGLSLEEINRAGDRSKDFVVVVDWKGAMELRKVYSGKAFLVFVDAPDEQLVRRIKERGADVERRIARIHKDRNCIMNCNFVTVNSDGDLEKVMGKLKTVLRMFRIKEERRGD